MTGTSVVVDLLLRARDLASAPLRGLVATVKFLDSEISVVAGKIRNALSGLFGSGVDSAIDFEAALARVNAKAGGSEADLAKLKAAANAAAKELGLGADGAVKAAQALESLTGAGLSVDQAIGALPATLRIAKNEQIATEDAARNLTDVMSVMGIEFDKTGRAADVLQKSADLTSTSVSALAEAIRNGGGAAVATGRDLEETVTILTAFAKAGLQGSNAGTALKAVLNDIADPASKARQEMAKFGASTGDVREFIGRLIELGPKGVQVVRAFSDEAGPGLAALLKLGTAGIQEYARALNEDAVGGLDRASKTINTTTRGALEKLSSTWAQVKTTLSEPLLKPISEGAEALRQKLDELQNSGILEQVGNGVAKLFTDAGKVVGDFLGKVNWSNLKDEAGSAIAYVRTALDDTINGVQSKIQTVSDWTTTVFSPLTQAVDGYRLAWAVANKDQAEAARLQAQIEERTDAIGRALAGASGEYAKAGQAAQSLGQRSEKTAQATETLRAAAIAAADAVKSQQAEVDRLADANARGAVSSEEYGAAVQKLWALQENAKNAQTALKTAQDSLNASTAQAVELEKMQVVELAKIEPAVQGASEAARRYKDNLADVDRQIQAAENNAGNWREGLRLSAVQMIGLRDSAAALSEKLALVEEAQRNGLATDREVAPVKQAATAAQDRYNSALDEYVTQQERAVDAVQRANDLDQRGYDIKIRQKEAEADLAAIKGDVVAAGKAESEITELLIEQAERQTVNQQKEIEAYKANIEAVRLKLAADDELSAADQDQLAVMEDKLKALELERRSLQATAETMKDKAEAEKEAAKRSAEALKAQAQAAADAERETRRMASVVGYAAQNFGELSEKGQTALKAINTDAMARASKDGASLTRAILQLTQGLDEAAGSEIAFNERLQALADTASGIGPEADRARRELVFMAEQGARGIQSITRSGEEAVQTLDDIKNAALEAKDALSGLADDYEKQILQIRGDKKTLEQLDYEDQLRKLEELRQKSGQEGQREFEEAKARADELHRLKLEQIADDERATRKQRAEQPGTAGGGASGAPAKTHRLELVSPTGRNFTAFSENDPSAFLDELEAAKRRSLT